MKILKRLTPLLLAATLSCQFAVPAFAGNSYASSFGGGWSKYNEKGFGCFSNDYKGLSTHSGNAVLHLNDIPYCYYSRYKIWTPFGSNTSTSSRSYGLGPVQWNGAGTWTFQYKNEAQTSVNVQVVNSPRVILNRYRQRIGNVSSTNRKTYTCSDVSGTGLQEIFNSSVPCGTHIHSIHDESKNHYLSVRYPSGYAYMDDFSCVIIKHGMEGSWTVTGYSSSSSYSYVYTGNVKVTGSGSSWVAASDTQHYRICEGCGEKSDYTAHTFGNWCTLCKNPIGGDERLCV